MYSLIKLTYFVKETHNFNVSSSTTTFIAVNPNSLTSVGKSSMSLQVLINSVSVPVTGLPKSHRTSTPVYYPHNKHVEHSQN